MKRGIIIGATIATLTTMACSSEDSANAAPTGTKPNTPVVGTVVTPGWWEMTQTSAGEAPETTRECITAEDADVGKLLKEAAEMGGQCTSASRTIAGGRIDIRATCGNPDGSRTRSSIRGSYTPNSFAYDLALKGSVAGQPIDMRIAVKGQRVGGTCKAESA